MRGRVESLGDVEDQDMILLPYSLQPAPGEEHLGRRR